MSEWKYRAVGLLGTGLVRALFRTVRTTRTGTEHYQGFRRKGQPVVLACWHGQLLPLIHAHRGDGIVVLVSEHGDGEYVTRLLERNGLGTVRGSSTRGGAKGLKALVRAAARGHDLALTPDGPRGPYGVFKPGALAVAQMTGAPVLPLAAGAESGWRLSSWDGFLVPKPFTRVTIEYLPPVFVPRDASREDLERLALKLGDDLNALTTRLNPPGWSPPEPRVR